MLNHPLREIILYTPRLVVMCLDMIYDLRNHQSFQFRRMIFPFSIVPMKSIKLCFHQTHLRPSLPLRTLK